MLSLYYAKYILICSMMKLILILIPCSQKSYNCRPIPPNLRNMTRTIFHIFSEIIQRYVLVKNMPTHCLNAWRKQNHGLTVCDFLDSLEFSTSRSSATIFIITITTDLFIYTSTTACLLEIPFWKWLALQLLKTRYSVQVRSTYGELQWAPKIS